MAVIATDINRKLLRIGFALEYSLGHATHADNLKTALVRNPHIRPEHIDLPFQGLAQWWARLPGVRSNWSLRASMGAYLGLRRHMGTLQAALFHTQVTSLLSSRLMARIPSVVSLDATPIQFDALGGFYDHQSSGSRQVEEFKNRLHRAAFRAARHLITWSTWAKQSLVFDYGVPASKISVIPPGIDMESWDFRRPVPSGHGVVHLLFVGGDFYRKGGDTLLEAFSTARRRVSAHLHVVTRTSEIPGDLEGVTVYRRLDANSPDLLRLFRQADAFVFPTRADCLPLAVMEALAAGLPVICTDVAALPEAVAHQEAGWIVPPGDPQALSTAIQTLCTDAGLRDRLGRRAREVALERFNAVTNYGRLLEVLTGIAR